MTSPVHSGEPETPQTEAGRELDSWIEHHYTAEIVAIEREAAALAPGAGLDVERLARALMVVDDEDLLPSFHAEEVIAEYERLGATPDPRPETDPS